MNKVRPFRKVQADGVVECKIASDRFVCRFYDLPSFSFPISVLSEDELGQFALVEQCELREENGLICGIEPDVDEIIQSAIGTHIYLRFVEPGDVEIANRALEARGIDPTQVNLLIPARQNISVFLKRNGTLEDNAKPEEEANITLVRRAASKTILFLPHAVRQM